ncbi:MAG: pyrroline-5-carboxylate reductase [Alphaproteobacteria bacterium]
MDILLVGCGHLGQALLRRWLEKIPGLNFTVIKPTPLPDDLGTQRHVRWLSALPPDLPQPQAIVYAIRPQIMADTLPAYRALAQRATNISVAAGWTIQKLAAQLGDGAIIRTMPNVPAQIGQGMTPMCANAACDPAARRIAEDLFRAAGTTVWMETESHMDIATAVSGSGPAYLYLLTAAMEAAGISHGLPPATAALLARTTARGAANYMEHSGQTAEALYKAMLLPGGTTEAALQRLLNDSGMPTIVGDAIALATARARQIGAA